MRQRQYLCYTDKMNDFSAQLKKNEDLSLNAWPSHQIQFYDGWVLRFSYFYTHRTNCVEQIGNAVLPPESKIPECEAVYLTSFIAFLKTSVWDGTGMM